MKKMTEQNLGAAFSGESQAHVRYLAYAQVAEKDHRPNIARLFRAIAFAEQVHAINHYKELGQVNSLSQDLQVAIDGENYEVDDMYPAFRAVAELQGERGALRTTDWALQAEKVHAGMYLRAKQSVDGGHDFELGEMYICEECGYTVEGKPPDRCPLCGAPRERFKKF